MNRKYSKGYVQLRQLQIDFEQLSPTDSRFATGISLQHSTVEDLELNINLVDTAFRRFCIEHMPPHLQSLQLNIRGRIVSGENLNGLPSSLTKLGIRLESESIREELVKADFTNLSKLEQLAIDGPFDLWKFTDFTKCLDDFVKYSLPAATSIFQFLNVECDNSEITSKNRTPMEFIGPFPVNRLNFVQATVGIAENRKNPLLVEIHYHHDSGGSPIEFDVHEKLRFSMVPQ